MKKIARILLISLVTFVSSTAHAEKENSLDSLLTVIRSKQILKDSLAISTPQLKDKKWFESFSIRGYAQVRYNNLLNTNEDLKCEQCDKSWGGDGGFFIRRMRIIFYGQINEHVYFYVQPDFASSAGTSNNIAQLRDAYFDIGFDKKNEFRVRIGQSKVPYGFENMQSSQNRLALDRNDALNSAVSNERDLGVFFYWAPESRRKMFSSLVKDGLKGSGDYGCFAFGAYNGQTANQLEKNDQPHLVTRFTWPFAVKTQLFETAIQAYAGNVGLSSITKDVKIGSVLQSVKLNSTQQYRDQRIAATLVMYPKPFGFQAEYTVGLGPEFNKFNDSIIEKELRGGYVLLNYQLKVKNHLVIPFVRGQYYQGGKKHELDARSYRVQEYEFGIEWQPNKNFELVAMYTISKRRFEDFQKQENYQAGSLLRLQAQVNF